MNNITTNNPVRLEEEKEFVEEIAIQSNLNDIIKEYADASYYISNNIQAQTPSSFTTGNLISNSTSSSTFQIPIGCHNLSMFILKFTANVGCNNLNTAFGSATQNGAINCFYLPYIKTLSFFNSNGVKLCDVSNIDLYNRMSAILNMNYNKSSANGTRGFMQKSQRDCRYFNPSGTATTLPSFPDPYPAVANAAIGQQYVVETLDDPGVMYYPLLFDGSVKDMQYPPTAETTQYQTVHYSFRIGDLLPDSCFNVNRDLLFKKVSQIKITWAPPNQLGAMVQYTQNAANNLVPYEYAPTQVNPNPTPYTAYGITNMGIITFSQGNATIINALEDQQRYNCIPVIIPYIDYQQQAFTSPATSQNVGFKVSASNAVTNLYKCYYSVSIPDNYPLFNNTANFNEQNLQQLTVKLNTTTIRSNINLTTREDLTEMNVTFPNNSLTSYNAARYAGTYAFCLDSEPSQKVYDSTSLRGVGISPGNDMLVYFNATTSNTALNHNFYSVKLCVFYWKDGMFSTTMF